MAIVQLDPNVDASRCPACAGPMTEPVRGRHTRKWFRHCRNVERCNTTTVTDDEPRASHRPTLLPFTRVDQRSRAAGEREPGEDDAS